MIASGLAFAAGQTLVVTCDNPLKPSDPIVLEIDLDHSVVKGAVQLWMLNDSQIEWLDSVGYTYSLDRKSGLVHRVYPRTNTGYTFQCREDRKASTGAPK